jgi:nitrogen-specific signal transduction histidine kinase
MNETFFLSAKRSDKDSIESDFETFSGFGHVNEIVNALPYIVLVLNKNRQLVYGNSALIGLIGVEGLEVVLGSRPGEILNCVHSNETKGGCGTTESCRYCGAVKAIQNCMETGLKTVEECRITAVDGDKNVSYDFEITASPFQFDEESYVILSMKDISNEKRRKVLERVFFHDIINTAGGLNGFLEFLKTTNDPTEIHEMIRIAGNLGDKLVDEILAQRQLLSAENGELVVDLHPTYTVKILEEVIPQMEHHQVARFKNLVLDETSIEIEIMTDQVLLKRVLVNLIKNALEASEKGQTVTVGCKGESTDQIAFWVHNENEMPRQVQMQIFQRSFSTKGVSRGIGTYSIKLFTEFYLKGKVDFTSSAEKGTTFYLHFTID